MTVTTETNCGCAATALDKGTIERPRFFPRQLVTPDDLTLGQEYFRNKLRRMNRYLHGWGVVCGTRVDYPDPRKPWKVIIHRGYILGPYGDEIVIERDICFDLRTRCVTATGGDACDDIVDPLCPDQPREPRRKGKPYYIAVRYKELPSRPVRVQPAGCGCDDVHCEYSRWRDGYEICVIDECPPSHTAKPPSFDDLIKPHAVPDCPECPTDPWVVLARVDADDKGSVTAIDNCSCRRMVVSFAPYWLRCNEPVIRGDATPTDPAGGGGHGPVG